MAQQLISVVDTQRFVPPLPMKEIPDRTDIEGREFAERKLALWNTLEQEKQAILERLQRAKPSTELGEEEGAITTEPQPALEIRIGPVDVLAGGPEAHPLWGSWRATAEQFTRIRVDPDVLGGEPRVAGTRVQVSVLLGALSDGLTFAELLEEFPQLCAEDIREALLFAARLTSI